MALQDREVVQRLSAFAAGKPLPRGETITLSVAGADRRMALAFVRMGGEARPWAVGWQRGGRKPKVLTVPDGRNTDRIGAMLSSFAAELGHFLGSAVFGAGAKDLDEILSQPLLQLWVPNGAHLEMLHLINLRYTFARGDEEPERTLALRGLGRAAGYLYREASRPGEVSIVNASRALLDSFVFPVDDLRAQHLGLLLAMLKTPGKRTDREAAAEQAESESVSITLDPLLERDVLGPLVEEHSKALRDGETRKAKTAERSIAKVLEKELQRRLELTVSAAELLAVDARPTNPGVDDLIDDSLRTRWWEYLRLESALARGEGWQPPSAETDRQASAAARRYIRLAGAAEQQEAVLRLHDADRIEQAVATGDAVRGMVRRIERLVPPGGKQRRPHWEIETPLAQPFRLKPGDGLVTTFENGPGGGWLTGVSHSSGKRIALVCMNKRSTGIRADDPSFLGQEITLLPSSGGFLSGKMRRARGEGGPGSWITRRDGPRPSAAALGKGDLLAELEALRRS